MYIVLASDTTKANIMQMWCHITRAQMRYAGKYLQLDIQFYLNITSIARARDQDELVMVTMSGTGQ